MSRGGARSRSENLRRRQRIALCAAALVAIAVLPYVGSLGYPLLHDDRTLLDNPWMRQAGLAEIFGHDYWYGTRHAGSDLYRPVTIATLAWNVRTATGASQVRVVAVMLHAGVVLLAWWVLYRVQRRMGGDVDDGGLAAWIGAAIFAAHPLASEAVLFAVGRAELLAAGFGLLAFGLLIGEEGRDGARVALSAICFALAFLSKESAAAWILILGIGWGVSRLAGIGSGRLAAGLAAWLSTLVPLWIARGLTVGWVPRRPPWVDNPLVLEGFVTRVLNAVSLHAIYLSKMVWPVRLSVDHGFDQIAVRPSSIQSVGLASIVAVLWVAAAFALRRFSPAGLFLWSFVLVAFAVTGNFVFPIGTIFAERLAYLPLVGFCGLTGALIVRLLPNRRAVAVVVVVLVAVAAAQTGRRAGDLRSHTIFVEATASASPRAVKALVNVGRSRMRAGRIADAVEPLEKAVTIWPEYPRALALLAEVWSELGDSRAAVKYRERAENAAARARADEGASPPPSIDKD